MQEPATATEPLLFAVPASSALLQKTRDVLHRGVAADFELGRRAVVSAGILYVDSVIDGFVLSFMREGEASKLTQLLLRQLTLVIKGSCGVAIRLSAGSAQPSELEAISRFFARRVVTTVRDGVKVGLVIYPLDDAQHRALQQAMQAGARSEQRAAFAGALRCVLDEALARHFDEPFAVLQLGPLARAAVALGRKMIVGTARAALRVSVAQDSDDELRALARALKQYIVPASMCRPA